MLRIASNHGTRNEVDHGVLAENTSDIVAARLRRSGYPFLWGISCTFSAGEVVLSGTVPTFYLKQVAQELARHTPGVFRVDNRLLVASPPRSAKCTAECAAKPVAAGRRAITSTSSARSQPVRHPMTSPPAREAVASSAGAGSQEGNF